MAEPGPAAGRNNDGRRQMLGIWGQLAIVIAFTLLLTLPFIGRPFHMDDAGFIEFARVRQEEPMQLVLKDYTFFGQQNEYFLDTHPPLISSYIALVISVAGESEVALHLSFIVFPLIAAVSMFFLSRRFTRHAMLAAILLMATPGVIVMSNGLMSDLPGLSLWLASLTLYIYGLERDRLWLMALCALTMTLGVFTSYQVLSVIPLLLVYAVVRKRFSLLAVLPFVLPLSSFVSYSVWHYSVVGMLPRLSYGVGEPLAWYSIVQKGYSVFSAIGGAFIIFAVLLRVLVMKRWDFAVYLAFIVPLWIAVLGQFLAGQYSAGAAILSILMIPLGILFLYRVFADGWNRLDEREERTQSENVLLMLWLGGVLFYLIILLPYASVRYLLPAFPPMILLFVRLVEDRFDSERMRLRILGAAAALTAATGVLVAAADYQLAFTNREFAQNEAVEIGRLAAAEGHKVWFVGEFGYRFYMEQNGFEELPKDVVIPEGDVVIQSPLADPRPFSEDMKDRVDLVRKVGYSSMLPIRTLDFQDKAGFYGHFWGILPWSLSSGYVEEFLVYRVVPPSEDPEA